MSALVQRRSLRSSIQSTIRPLARLDWAMLAAAVALSLWGLVMINGATVVKIAEGAPNHWVERQSLALALGIAAASVVALIDYRPLRAWSVFAYGGALVLLVLVAIPNVGVEINGARAWFQIGPMQFQPAEFAKIAIVMTLAAHFHDARENAMSFRALGEALGMALVPMGLIMLQPDLGTFMVFAAIVAGVLLVAGVKVRYLLSLVALAVGGTVGVLQTSLVKTYQRNRLLTFIDPEAVAGTSAGYNVAQAQIAVGSGQIFGQGLGQGSQTLSQFVPENQTDFIFTVIGEQTGFIGSVMVVALLGLLIWRALETARTSRDMFGTLIATGVASLLIFQVFINIGMSLGIMPITGLPLPFVSYGGSSLITSWVLVGLLQSIYMRRGVTA